MNFKNIIQRNLPLNIKYNLIDKKYISLIDGSGCTCDNCGKLIANIATVKSETGVTYNVGFDCLETFLINNSLLDGISITEYQHFKKCLPTFIKRAKELKESVGFYTGLEFDFTNFNSWIEYGNSTYLTFYYTHECGKRCNSNLRLKNDVVLNDFLSVVKSINPHLNITTI